VTYCHFRRDRHQRSPAAAFPVPASLKANPQAEALNKLLQEIAWQAVSTYPMSGVKTATACPSICHAAGRSSADALFPAHGLGFHRPFASAFPTPDSQGPRWSATAGRAHRVLCR